MADVEEGTLCEVGGKFVVHVQQERGEELRLHLEAQGIAARLSEPAAAPFDRLELDGDIDPEVVQSILDQWEQ
jgi:hypothetical protein